jgi:hypothetical protein
MKEPFYLITTHFMLHVSSLPTQLEHVQTDIQEKNNFSRGTRFFKGAFVLRQVKSVMNKLILPSRARKILSKIITSA